MTDPVSELITDAVASTVLPDIATVAVRANMVEDAFSIGSLAVSVTFMVSPDIAMFGVFARTVIVAISGNTVPSCISD